MSNPGSVLKLRSRTERKATDSPWAQGLARSGLATRGMMHLVVGWLALRIATGDRGRQADQQGALSVILRQPLGRFLVLSLAVGFLGYAIWRLGEAAIDPSDQGVLKRIGYAARGVVYLAFFGTALSLALGSSNAGGGSAEQQDATARLLALSFGRPLVAAVGLGIMAVGAWNGWTGITRRFEKDLKRFEMSSGQCSVTVKLGVVGHVARMAAYLVSGGFVVRAALRFDPNEGVGLDAALHELGGNRWGVPMLGMVAAGLIAFGAYQFLLARYRQVLGS